MTIEKFEFINNRVAPRRLANCLAENEPINVDIPVDKLPSLLKSLPKLLRIRIRLIPKNANAAEYITGSLFGALGGVGLGILVKQMKGWKGIIIVAGELITAALGYFLVRYDVDVYVRSDRHGNEVANLKFRSN